MNYIIKAFVVILTLSSIESVAAASKKVRKPSYIVKNYHKLPKKMPKLKMKQERIAAQKTDFISVITMAE